MHGIRIMSDTFFSLINVVAGAYRLIRMIVKYPIKILTYQGIWDFLLRNGSLDTCEIADCIRKRNIKKASYRRAPNTNEHVAASSKVCSYLPNLSCTRTVPIFIRKKEPENSFRRFVTAIGRYPLLG